MECNNKPLVTFSVLFYNQERFVRDAVKGALSQDYENLEIVLSDDCSTDSTYSILKECVKNYNGPHKIVLNRNQHNLGIMAHCEKIFKDYFHGEIMVGAGGDDVSLPTRVSESVAFLLSHPQVQSLTTFSEQVDINLEPISGRNDFICEGESSVFSLDDYFRFKDFVVNSSDSRAFRRSLIDKFPPLSISKEEDLEMFFRSLLIGQVAIMRTPLVKRRVHGQNISKKAHSIDYRNSQKEQMLSDAKYALERGYINQLQYDRSKKKIEEVIKVLINVDNSRRHPLIYSCFHHFDRLLDSIYMWICKF